MSIDENEEKDYSYIIDALREDWRVPSVRAEACLVIRKLMQRIEQMSNKKKIPIGTKVVVLSVMACDQHRIQKGFVAQIEHHTTNGCYRLSTCIPGKDLLNGYYNNDDVSETIDLLSKDERADVEACKAVNVAQKLTNIIDRLATKPIIATGDLLTPAERDAYHKVNESGLDVPTQALALLISALDRLAPNPKKLANVPVSGWDAIFDMKVNSSARYLNEGMEYRCKDGILEYLAFPTAGLECKAKYTKSDLPVAHLNDKIWYKIN